MKAMRYKFAVLLSLLSLPAMLLVATGGSAAAVPHRSCRCWDAAVTSKSLGSFKPTFAGPAATGCAGNCNLLSGPVNTPSTAAAASGHPVGRCGKPGKTDTAHAMPLPDLRQLHVSAAQRRQLDANSPSNPLPSVSCLPLGPGCDNISTSAGGATGVKGLNAVDSASLPTNPSRDIEPPDQGLCAGNGFVVETNNIGEILVFNTALKRLVRADLARHAHGAHRPGTGAAAAIPPACTTPPMAGTSSSPRSSRPARSPRAAPSPAASRAWPTTATRASR